MARKTLLTEGEIRQFMKLANLLPIGQGRLAEYGLDAPGNRAEEDELDADLGHMDADVHDQGDEIGDLEADLGAADDELAVDDADAETAEELVVDLLALVQDWAASHDVAMDVDADGGDEELGLDDEAVVDDEAAMDMPGDIELDAAPEDELALEEKGAPQTKDVDALVAEVARRVAARLSKENNQQKMADELTERIFKRITGS